MCYLPRDNEILCIWTMKYLFFINYTPFYAIDFSFHDPSDLERNIVKCFLGEKKLLIKICDFLIVACIKESKSYKLKKGKLNN